MTVIVRHAPPFKVRLAKLSNGLWGAHPIGVMTFFTWADETPEKAFFGLMKVCGWHWTGARWERWVNA